jgi:hypothetical protein
MAPGRYHLALLRLVDEVRDHFAGGRVETPAR